MNYKMIDALLDADKKLVEGWGEARALGRSDIFDNISSFMSVDCNYNVSILDVFNSVRDNDNLSVNSKWTALESIAYGLGEVACKLEFIGKYRIKQELTVLDLLAMEVL